MTNPQTQPDPNPAIDASEGCPVTVDYINYRGERSTRRILPNRIVYGATEYHPRHQWLLEAMDLDKSAMRIFALEDMRFLDATALSSSAAAGSAREVLLVRLRAAAVSVLCSCDNPHSLDRALGELESAVRATPLLTPTEASRSETGRGEGVQEAMRRVVGYFDAMRAGFGEYAPRPDYDPEVQGMVSARAEVTATGAAYEGTIRPSDIEALRSALFDGHGVPPGGCYSLNEGTPMYTDVLVAGDTPGATQFLAKRMRIDHLPNYPDEVAAIAAGLAEFCSYQTDGIVHWVGETRAALANTTQPAAGQGAGDAPKEAGGMRGGVLRKVREFQQQAEFPEARGGQGPDQYLSRSAWEVIGDALEFHLAALAPSTSKAAETLAKAIKLKMDEPHFREWREKQADDITKPGYLLAFRVRPTGTNSLFVRLSSGRDIIVGEHEWTPAPSTSKAAPLSDQGDGWRPAANAPKTGVWFRAKDHLTGSEYTVRWCDGHDGVFRDHNNRVRTPALWMPPTPADDTAREGK
jgi:hypothetical protein